MAEINIQRKSGTNALWWILAIVAILVILWFLFAGGTTTDLGRTGSSATMTAAMNAAETLAFGVRG